MQFQLSTDGLLSLNEGFRNRGLQDKVQIHGHLILWILLSFLSVGLCNTNCVKNKSEQLEQLEAKNQEIIETEAQDFLSSV